MARDLAVANTIVEQLGGSGRLIAMLGARSFRGSNCIRATLTPADLYTVESISLRGTSVNVVSTHENIFANMLRELIERNTTEATGASAVGLTCSSRRPSGQRSP
jgi:hypothetical protein